MSEQSNHNTPFNNWDNLVAPVRNDIVFEGRNKAYGAYDLRVNNNKSLGIALLITVTAITLIIGFPKIMELFSKKTVDVEVPIEITNVDLTPPPPVDPTEPPPPPPPPPPIMETVKFTPPVVTDEEVAEEPPPIQTDDLPQISTVTQAAQGNDDDIVIPDEGGNGVVEPTDNKLFQVVEQMPEFPGGPKELIKFLQNNVKYPMIDQSNGIEGVCYISFIVEKDGSITDVKVARGVPGGPNCDKEAIRVIKSMPKWKVGKQNGHPVRVSYVQQVRFALN